MSRRKSPDGSFYTNVYDIKQCRFGPPEPMSRFRLTMHMHWAAQRRAQEPELVVGIIDPPIKIGGQS